MKKVILILTVLLLLAVVIPAQADTWTPAMYGTVTSVKHVSNRIAALIFTLDVQDGPCESMTVYATGWLAAKWDSRVRVGISLSVGGTPRDTGPCSIDAVSISR